MNHTNEDNMKVVLAIVAVMSMPVIGHTQSLSRLHVEGSGGVYIPNTFGVGDQELGWIGGARAGYQLRGGMRVVVHASYAEVDEFARIGTVNDFVVVGLRERLLTAGVDFPLGGVVPAAVTRVIGRRRPLRYPGCPSASAGTSRCARAI
jgi:hypothetical protein